MDDPFVSPVRATMVRHRSRANLASPLPAPPSSRSLAAQLSPTASPQRRASPEYTGHALRQHLASLLDQKTTQLQMLGSMGQEILKQQQELETRIKGFDDDEDADDEVGEATKEKLKSLDEAMRQWEAQNDDMMMELGGKANGDMLEAPGINVIPPSTSSNTLNRRQRNTQHRAMDMEFATEIGKNLLHEVKRLQNLLTDRDNSLTRAAEEKDVWTSEQERLRGAIRLAEGNVDRYKEENWNLEVALQELRSSHADVQDQLNKTNAEQTRLTRSLVSVRELAEMHKVDAEKNAQLLEELRNKHETDLAVARKTTFGLQRDKSDLQEELKIERNRRVSALRSRVSRGASASPGLLSPHSMEEYEEGDDVFGEGPNGLQSPKRRGAAFDNNENALSPGAASDFESSPNVTPSRPGDNARAPLSDVYINEIDELRDSLERAKAEIAGLKGEVEKARAARRMPSREAMGLRTPGTPSTPGGMDDEDSILAAGGRGRGGARGRRGRGRGFANLTARLGFARVRSNLSASSTPSGDRSFNSSSSGTPDLLRYHGTASPALSTSELGLDDSRPSSFMGPSTALADELGAGQMETLGAESFADAATATDWSPEKPAASKPLLEQPDSLDVESFPGHEANTPRKLAVPAGQSSGEVTPTRKTSGLPTMSRSSSAGGETTDAETEYTDARESVRSVSTATQQRESMEGMSEAEGSVSGAEYATAESSAGSDSEDDTKRLTISGLGSLGLAGMAAGGYATVKSRKEAKQIQIQERIVEVPVERIVEKIVEVRVEVPIEKIIEKRVEVPVEVERIVEKLVEVPVEVERIVEIRVEVPVEVERIVEKVVEVPVEVERIVEIRVEVPVEVERIVEKVVEVPVEVERIVEIRVEVPVEVERIVEKVVEIEKRVEVPVEVIVERIVEIEKIVEKIVTVERIVEKPVEVIKEVERIVEVPKVIEVEKVVERIVEREVEVPKIVEVEKVVEKYINVDHHIEVPVEKIVEVPKIVEVEKIVEKIIDRPVEVIKEVRVERVVEVPVEVIREVEKMVTVEKIVEKPVEIIREVERIVEKPVDRIIEIEKIIEKPVDRIVEVEKIVDRPVDRIVVVEKIVEKIVDRVVEVEKLVEVPVDRIVEIEKIVEKVVEKIVEVPAPQSTPDIGLWRVHPGANYDFLKSPPPPFGGKSDRGSSDALGLGTDSEAGTSPRSPRRKDVSASPVSPDKTRPPTMTLPPPPTVPPPAEQKKTSVGPPPRPTSPPPDELVNLVNVRRASRSAANTSTARGAGGLMGPPDAITRKPSRPGFKIPPSPSASLLTVNGNANDTVKRRSNQKTIGGATQWPASAASSFSAFHENNSVSSVGSLIPAGQSGAAAVGSTDPETIQAITQTMIGEYLWKYTRRALGKGQSGNRHKRFFWIHPYTKTLYWSEEDPGSSVASESKAKSVYIASVRAIDDLNNSPPGLYNKSIIVATTGREIQFTAPDKDRHDLWMSALSFLLQQQAPSSVTDDFSPQTGTMRRADTSRSLAADEQGRLTSTLLARSPTLPRSPMSMRSLNSSHSLSLTPKAYPRPPSALSARAASAMSTKRSGTAAFEYVRRHEAPATIHGGHRYKGPYKGTAFMEDFDVVDPDDGDDPDASFEGMDNVRACCDGKHTVGHHHHHPELNEPERPPSRAATPSLRAFSMRSRRGSVSSPNKKSGTVKGKGREDEEVGEDGRRSVARMRSKSALGHR